MRWFGLLLIALLAQPALANEAEEWLEGMSHSLMQSNYRGVFVYEMGGRMEAMQIVHAMRSNGEYERLLSLTGNPREVIRSPEGVTCILPKRKAVMVDHNMPHGPVPVAFVNNLDRIKQHYKISLEGSDRVSGLDSRIIAVTPLDQYRYGYRLWLTEADKLPVRLELLKPQGSVLEQMMFTDLKVVKDLPDDWLEPQLDGSQLEWMGQKEDSGSPVSNDTQSHWDVAWLPDGFERTHHNMYALSKQHSHIEHLVYSDGLASVSVYVENLDADRPHLQGLKTMGATHALGRQVDQYQVTVVGEVPAETIEMIAASVHYTP